MSPTKQLPRLLPSPIANSVNFSVSALEERQRTWQEEGTFCFLCWKKTAWGPAHLYNWEWFRGNCKYVASATTIIKMTFLIFLPIFILSFIMITVLLCRRWKYSRCRKSRLSSTTSGTSLISTLKGSTISTCSNRRYQDGLVLSGVWRRWEGRVGVYLLWRFRNLRPRPLAHPLSRTSHSL